MSPLARKTREGLPVFYLQDIPPVATGGPPIDEPRIYFGEETDTYVIVKGSTPEFDYPKGADNVYATYAGTAGRRGGFARRALFEWYFKDPNLLLTSYITGDSRVMFRRTIQDRARTIASFLSLGRDLYLVISEGRLFWMQDAAARRDRGRPRPESRPDRGCHRATWEDPDGPEIPAVEIRVPQQPESTRGAAGRGIARASR